MRSSLGGRVALVTGASRGIGRSIALGLAAAGARIAINHRASKDEAVGVVREVEALDQQAMAVEADISNPGEVETLIARVERELGGVDILVHNAGIARALPLEAIRVATWDATFAVNLRAAFVLSAAVIPGMRARRWGRLLFISSSAARVGGIVGPHYAASKAGLEGLMHSYASLLAREGITANAIAPALIETEMLAGNHMAVPDRLPVGRLGTSEEVAEIAVAVASNAFITGQTVQVNGGIYMT
jgi:3-oxoacyl-[acyl-carrier protein] reductase